MKSQDTKESQEHGSAERGDGQGDGGGAEEGKDKNGVADEWTIGWVVPPSAQLKKTAAKGNTLVTTDNSRKW